MDRSGSVSKPWSPWHQRLHEELLADPDLLPSGSALLIAVSGGQDSMALLGLLRDLQRLHHWNLQIWHGDHGWHQQSKKVASELNTWCQAQQLPFWCDRSEAKQTHNEAAARQWRYQKLRDRAEKLSEGKAGVDCCHVVTGHTASDRAETLLLNLARGCHLAGLSSMRRRRPLEGERAQEKKKHLVRPLLNFSRDETAAICTELRLPIWLDPSNTNPEFSRNRIRQKVLPVLEALHPGCSQRMAALAERLSHQHDDQQALNSLALAHLQHPDGLCRQGLSSLPPTARATLLALWMKRADAPNLSGKQLAELSHSLETGQPPGKRDLGKGWTIGWRRERIELKHSC